jgi:WD40 repeat protein
MGHQDIVNSVCFSVDNKKLVSSSNDMTIKIWDAETGFSIIKTLFGYK